MELSTIVFDSNDGKCQIDFNKLDDKIRQMEGFPNSTRIFEEFFANARYTVEKHGKIVDEPKGKSLQLSGDDIYFGLHYKKDNTTDCLQIVIKDHDYYKHLGMTRARNSLGFNYRTQIPPENTRKDKLFKFLYGEMQPYGFFTMDEDRNVLVDYNFKKE